MEHGLRCISTGAVESCNDEFGRGGVSSCIRLLGLLPALHPTGDVLEGMKTSIFRIVATGEGVAELISQHRVIAHPPDAEEVHAIRHVLVLAEVVGCCAEVSTLRPSLYRLEGVDLERSKDHVPKRAIR